MNSTRGSPIIAIVAMICLVCIGFALGAGANQNDGVNLIDSVSDNVGFYSEDYQIFVDKIDGTGFASGATSMDRGDRVIFKLSHMIVSDINEPAVYDATRRHFILKGGGGRGICTGAAVKNGGNRV